MAVRNDFTAGEVLAAADLNDTFGAKVAYPSGGNDGDLLAKDGTDAEWIAVPEAGLTLITAETFSAVSSVSVNGCFTGTYQNYRVVYAGSGTGTNLIQMRLRGSGTDLATAYLNVHVGIRHDGTVVNRGNTPNQWELVYTSANNGFSFDIMRPNEALMKSIVGTMYGINDTGVFGYGSTLIGQNSTTTAYDGLSVFVGAGNISGSIRIYGYKD
jgi:hypothetical protein